MENQERPLDGPSVENINKEDNPQEKEAENPEEMDILGNKQLVKKVSRNNRNYGAIKTLRGFKSMWEGSK